METYETDRRSRAALCTRPNSAGGMLSCLRRSPWIAPLAAALTLFGCCAAMAALQRVSGNRAALFQNYRGPMNTRTPDGWSTTSPREGIAPRFEVAAGAGRAGSGALAIQGGGNAAAVGSWRRDWSPVRAGVTYRFTAWRRAEGVAYPTRSLTARLVWLDARGQPARPPDYVPAVASEGAWTRMEHVCVAPERAQTVRVELTLAWAPDATVWWDDVSLTEETPSAGRVVRALTVYHRPQGTGAAARSVEEFCRLMERAADQKPDVICLPEGVTVIGTGKSYAEVAESVPGPTTTRLGAAARKLKSYICAGLYEREGKILYNTAVLLDREGRVAGKYRKTHLPREEVEAGLTPGSEYPVFQTDFGKVGMMICWDLQFPEPSRALALKGAELILLPIWGGSDILARARAMENHVFLITSSYDMKTFIVDPKGDVAAEATREQPLALAELHLDRKIVQPWLGDMRTRTWNERRADLRVDGP